MSLFEKQKLNILLDIVTTEILDELDRISNVVREPVTEDIHYCVMVDDYGPTSRMREKVVTGSQIVAIEDKYIAMINAVTDEVVLTEEGQKHYQSNGVLVGSSRKRLKQVNKKRIVDYILDLYSAKRY